MENSSCKDKVQAKPAARREVIPELLAPAGTIEAGLAAFDHGADAVYTGLNRFNARERSRNLSMDEMSKLIAFAHKTGKRVYVTLNTLVKENELVEIAEILSELVILRPDALIVQDIGLVAMVKKWFPELAMHASTQMGIHNSMGARAAGKMGISRVILERQTTYSEIREIKRNTDMELEVFVHGALCCGRSGTCLFSSWMGGWSGNRGKCKQPCRRRYFSEHGNGFFFSPKDLCSIDAIQELKEIGITSVKIEGRLKPVDYVAKVVSAYRIMLDAEKDETLHALQKARAVLSGAFSRKSCGPFKKESDFRNVIQHDTLGATGVLCGKIVGSRPDEIAIALTKNLFLHDRIRVQPESGDEGPAVTVSKMSVNGYETTRAEKGKICLVRASISVKPGALVYKTGSQTADMSERIQLLPLERTAIDFEIDVSRNGISVTTNSRKWSFESAFPEAKTTPVSRERIEDEFRKSRSEKFKAGTIHANIGGSFFIPAAELKNIRRSFWEWVETEFDPETLKQAVRSRVDDVQQYLSEFPVFEKVSPEKTVMIRNKHMKIEQSIIAVHPETGPEPGEELVLPGFCPEHKLKECFETAKKCAENGVRRFRATSLYALELLHEIEDTSICASFGIPACNSMAVEFLLESGASKVMAWAELDKSTLEKLSSKFNGRLEIFSYGRIPLFTTRMQIPAAEKISDGRGACFILERSDDLTTVYSGKVLSMPAPESASIFIDLSNSDQERETTDSFNYDRELA